ncbi:hypothetical protein ACTXJ1_10310 [Brachybacterium alimentarium]|uniref:hypothetical protein n=1 Tax=Brachybacterium alimentarium TaxID=47845 RepID=UPI003FD617E2
MMQLVMLAEEHPRALNHDLIRVGHRVRDLDDPESGLLIADLLDLVAYADPSSAIYRALNPDWEWDLGNQLMAYLIDFQQMQAWAEGGKKGPRPKPIPRPGVSEKNETKYTTRKKSTRAEIDAYLASRVKPKQ